MRRIRFPRLLLPALVAPLLVSPAIGATIAQFTFENATAGSTTIPRSTATGSNFPFTSEVTPANVTLSTLQAFNNLNQSNANVRTNTVDGSTPGGKFMELSPFIVQSAIPGLPSESASTYAAITITPAPGYQIDYTSFSMDLGAASAVSTGGIVARFRLFYSLNGGTSWTVIGTESTVSLAAGAPGFTGFQQISRDLAAALGTQSGAVTFALGFGDNSSASLITPSTSAPKGDYFDDVLIEGAVSQIPEPASLTLLGLGLLCCVRRRA